MILLNVSHRLAICASSLCIDRRISHGKECCWDKTLFVPVQVTTSQSWCRDSPLCFSALLFICRSTYAIHIYFKRLCLYLASRRYSCLLLRCESSILQLWVIRTIMNDGAGTRPCRDEVDVRSWPGLVYSYISTL